MSDPSAVLIVDDDPQVAAVLRRLLTKEGYRCTVAVNASEARARLAENNFAVALVDVSMPGEPGLDLVNDVLPNYAELAVVMVTGLEGPHIAEGDTLSGTYGYVVKPIRARQLLMTVTEASRRRTLEIERALERAEALKQQQLTLAVAEERWRVAFESAPVAIVELALDGTITRANRAMEELLEVASGQLEGTNLAAYSHPAEGSAGEQSIRALASGEARGIALRHLVTAQGNDRWATGLGLIIKGSNGQPDRSLNYMVDGTDAHLARARIVEAQARLSALVEHNVDAIVVQDVIGGPLVYASPGFSKILGISSADSIGSSLQDWIHPDDLTKANERMAHLAAGLGTLVTFDCRLRRSDGSWRHVEVTGTNLIDNPAVRGVVNNLHDVTDRVEAASRLAHQAMHDTLTGLPNRTLFLDRLDQALARAARSARPCALLFVDLDRFKHINDTLGHAAGDQLLTTVAERLHQAVRPGDSVARLGGDEFVVLAENVDPATALTIAHRVRAIIAQPVALSHRAVLVTCSVGIALSDRYAPEALLQEADMAVYRSKAMGGNRLEVYDHAMRAQAHRRLELEDLVRSAVSGAESLLAMHYQPIVELATGTVVGTEALARISEPGGSIVGPNDFIPVAEESGLILPLGLAVLDLACAQQARWQAAKAQHTHVAINVSGRQLSGSQFVRSVADALAVYHLQPDNLCIELTESTLIDAGSSTQTHLEDLKKIGVTLAMDDFGTGWSSLSYLRQFPIDVVKIDQSFVAGLGTDDENTELVRAVVGLGRALDITTVAEGVETETQDRLLCEMGCDRGQGYLYGRPQPAE